MTEVQTRRCRRHAHQGGQNVGKAPDRGNASPWRWFCSDDVPVHERLDVLNASFGGSAFPGEVMPADAAARLYMAGYAISLPGVFITHGVNRDVLYRRTSRHVAADAEDVFMLTITLGGGYHVHQQHADFLVRPGEGWAAVSGELATASNAPGQMRESLALMLPRAAFAHARLDMGKLLRKPVVCDNQGMHLLLSYLVGIESATAPLSPELGQRAADHISDLVLLSLGGSGEAAELARQRSVPDARLDRIKRDILQRIRSGLPLHLAALAARHGISPVYVQKLFERDGGGFSAYVLEQRLERVRSALRSPRFVARSISAIAYDAGFNNLSWFNRAFRRRYGMTPSDMRATTANVATQL